MKSLKISERTHERLKNLGVKDQSYEDVIVDLLEERKHLPKLKATLQSATEKINKFKKDVRQSHFGAAGAAELVQVLEQFIKDVENR